MVQNTVYLKKDIEYVGLLPDNWDRGFSRILQAINIDKIKQQISTPSDNVDEIKSKQYRKFPC
jgi:hypothetical protein